MLVYMYVYEYIISVAVYIIKCVGERYWKERLTGVQRGRGMLGGRRGAVAAVTGGRQH